LGQPFLFAALVIVEIGETADPPSWGDAR